MNHHDHATKQVLTIAHRGAAGYAPENTMAAFELAIRMGADYVELDVQLSKDEVLVVIHDDTVNRTTNGKGHVRDLTLEELRCLDAGSWFDQKFSGERIPTLTEVLDLCRGKVGVLIEIKWPEHYAEIESKLAGELVNRNKAGQDADMVIIQSFDSRSVERFHTRLPDVPVGVLIGDASGLDSERLAQLKAFSSYINPYLELATSEIVDAIHACGMKIFVWTVRSQSAVAPLLEAGVDGIITDYPDYV